MTDQRISELIDGVVAEVHLSEACPGEGGGVIGTTPNDHLLHGRHSAALDHQGAQLGP